MNKKKGLFIGLLAVGVAVAVAMYKTPAQKLAALVADAQARGDTDAIAIYNSMTPAEVDTMYTVVFDYMKKGLPQPDPSTPLGQQLNAILAKYKQ